jgi:hypothetical protein
MESICHKLKAAPATDIFFAFPEYAAKIAAL